MIWKLVTSRAGLLGIAVVAMFTLHQVDKSRALQRAVDGYVLKTELTAAQAERDALARRLAAAAEANAALEAARDQAERYAQAFELELGDYEAQTVVPPTCTVDDALLDRLRF